MDIRELALNPARRFRRAAAIIVLASMATQTACYTYAVTPGTGPTVGAGHAFVLTDRGRADLADQIGPGVLQVEGALVQDDGERYVVSVARVRGIDGSSSHWSGERITVAHSHVATVRERQFSRGRTAVAIAAAAVAFGAFVLSRDLLGLGNVFGERPDPPPPID